MTRKMKYSGIEWIGRIPSHWGICNFGNVSDIYGRIGFRGYTTEDMVDKGEGPITLSPSNIVDQKLNLSKCSYISWHKYEESPEIKVFKNDIILVKTASVGKCAIYNSDEVATLNPQLVVLKNIVCDYMFLYYLIISDVIQTPIVLDNFGSVIPTITQENINHYKIPLPPIEEQQAISVFLSNQCAEIDAVIVKTKETIEEYKKLKQSVITEAVTKGIRENRPMKNSGVEWIGNIPEEWNVIALKILCSMRAGKNLSAEQIADEGQYPVYGGNGIRGYYSECNTSGEFLLVGRQGALCGNVHRVSGDFWATEHAVVTKCSDYTYRDFLYYLLIGMNLNRYASNTAAQPGLAVGEIVNVRTCLVPLEEQKEIADYLDKKCDEIDTLIAKKTALLEELESYKKTLIYEYVTGKKEVPDGVI